MASMQDALMTHTGRKPQGLQFAQDTMQSIQNAPGNILKWAQNNPVEAGLTAVSTVTPYPFDAIPALGAEAAHYYNNPDNLTPGNLSISGASVLAPAIPGMAVLGALKKSGKSMADALNPDRAADIINNKFADADEMRKLERRVYNLTDIDDFTGHGKKTGNLISTPFQANGPKMSVNDIESMESALKFKPVSKGYYDKKIFSPEDFELGSLIIPNPGDPTLGGRLQSSISGKSNVINTSGPDFMRQKPKGQEAPPIWASGDKVMGDLQNRAILAGDNPAYFVNLQQGPKSVPFNAVAAQRYEELLDTSKITTKGADEAEKMLYHQSVNKSTGKVTPLAPWQKNIPRANSPEFAQWLHNLPGTSKSEVVLRLNKGKVIDEGMPDVREIIRSFIGSDSAWSVDKAKALSDLANNKSVNGLMGDPLVGGSIAKVTPGAPLSKSDNPSFPTKTTGEYSGDFGFRPRRSEVWRDWYTKGNYANKPDNSAHRGFTLAYPPQVVDRQWQDVLMKNREDAIRQK